MTKEEQIINLCDSWISQATANGGIQIGMETERYRLRNNAIQFHELNYSELMAAGVGLTKILLLKGMNTIVDFDHLHFWSWAAEVILETQDCYFNHEEREIQQLFNILIRSCLAGIRAPTDDPGYRALRQQADEMTEFNAKQLLQNSTLITAYLGFPFLEGLCKKVCSEYVDYSGKVIKEFSAPDRDYKVGIRCRQFRSFTIFASKQCIRARFKNDAY